MDLKKLAAEIITFAIKTAVGCFLIGLTVWLVLWTLLSPTKLTGSEVAGWVQAIGSIGAIIGALAVANWQHRKQQSNLAAQQVERQRAMHGVIGEVVEHVKCLKETMDSSQDEAKFREYWDVGLEGTYNAALQTLNALPAHELGGPERAVQFMAIVGAMSKICVLLERDTQSGNPPELKPIYPQLAYHANQVAFSWGKFMPLSAR
ncbi:hypothetical protein [Pseudomonas sp. Hg5Tf]|uniref:DUF4760 domain-containing protein n=1 Tax=Pseudomonas sp. Hg7Tf TaxID=3236988 RepID=A0AB39I617_9PSED|nr:hypothetical protein [Pseudomonas sp. Hg5Tf]MDH2558363.1 hypothetical protein [Pseudomonas sp. Hg5Tf]